MTTISSSGPTTTADTSATGLSSSATTALLTSLGVSGNIDVTGLAGQLSQAEYAGQIGQLNTRTTALATQISEASTLMNMTSSLTRSLSSVINAGQLAATPQIANGAVATVSAGTTPGKGTATLEVTALAHGQTLTSAPLAASTASVGSGSLQISFGTVSGATFTPGSASPVSVTIPAGSSLADVASAINAAGAGVAAYVANNSDGQQLVITGPQGAANAFTITASEDAADPGLAKLAWTPGSSGGASLAAPASDAVFLLDGVRRSAASNTIPDAAPGISLNLTGINTGSPTTISFTDPTTAIASSMNDLVSALNGIVTELNTDTAPGGALNNNPGARALQTALSALSSTKIMPNAASGTPATLGDLGLTTSKDGSFALDTSVLNKALRTAPAAVAGMFTTGVYGVYATVFKLSQAVNSASNGNSLAGSVKSMQAQQSAISTRLSKLSDQQTALRTRLVTQFSALNTVVLGSKSTQSFLTQQVALWTNSKN